MNLPVPDDLRHIYSPLSFACPDFYQKWLSLFVAALLSRLLPSFLSVISEVFPLHRCRLLSVTLSAYLTDTLRILEIESFERIFYILTLFSWSSSSLKIIVFLLLNSSVDYSYICNILGFKFICSFDMVVMDKYVRIHVVTVVQSLLQFPVTVPMPVRLWKRHRAIASIESNNRFSKKFLDLHHLSDFLREPFEFRTLGSLFVTPLFLLCLFWLYLVHCSCWYSCYYRLVASVSY